MNRRPPRSTRTDTPLPSPTLFRSAHARSRAVADARLRALGQITDHRPMTRLAHGDHDVFGAPHLDCFLACDERLRPIGCQIASRVRSEEHTSELQSLMRISYAVFCLKQKINRRHN